MNLPLLKILGHEIAKSNWSKLNKQVFWSACTIAFFGSCRMGELLPLTETKIDPFVTLLWKDIKVKSDSCIIHLKSPKSRQPGGEFIDLFTFSDTSCCPVAAIKFLQSLISIQRNFDWPVFTFDSGIFLTKAKFNQTIKLLLANSFQHDSFISSHSFRQGIPSALAKFPDMVKDNHIMGWGRWCSDAYLSYTKLKSDQKNVFLTKSCMCLIKKFLHALSLCILAGTNIRVFWYYISFLDLPTNK